MCAPRTHHAPRTCGSPTCAYGRRRRWQLAHPDVEAALLRAHPDVVVYNAGQPKDMCPNCQSGIGVARAGGAANLSHSAPRRGAVSTRPPHAICEMDSRRFPRPHSTAALAVVGRVLAQNPATHFYWRSTPALCGDWDKFNAETRALNAVIWDALRSEHEGRVRFVDGYGMTQGRCDLFDDHVHHSLLAHAHVTAFLKQECGSWDEIQ